MAESLKTRKTELFFQIAYLVLLTAFIGYRSFFNTMIRKNLGILESSRLMNLWMIVAAVYILLKEIILRCYTKKDILFAIWIGLSFVASYYFHWTKWVELVPFLVVGAKKVPFDKILKTFLLIVGGIMLTAFAASELGYTSYLVYSQSYADGSLRMRHAFGTTYPTTFSEFVFFLSAAGLYVRRKKAGFADVAFLVFIGSFLKVYSDAKTDALCLFLLAGLATILMVQRQRRERGLRRSSLETKLSAWLVPVFPIVSTLMILLTIFYDPSSGIMRRLNGILTGRLEIGKKGYDQYGIFPGSWCCRAGPPDRTARCWQGGDQHLPHDVGCLRADRSLPH